MPDRFPPPGPSHLRPLPVGPGSPFQVGVSRPATDDDWWLAVLWVEDPRGVPRFRELAPPSGPPPEPPLMRLGPAFAGALSGFILEEAGRLQIRLAPVVPPEDPARTWAMPAAIRAAFRFEPLRVATMTPDDLTTTVLAGFARACAALGHR